MSEDPINYWSPQEDAYVSVSTLKDAPIPFISIDLIGQAPNDRSRVFRALLAQREARFMPGSRTHLLTFEQARGVAHDLRAEGFEVVATDPEAERITEAL